MFGNIILQNFELISWLNFLDREIDLRCKIKNKHNYFIVTSRS
jgi:hypothetical protein